MRLEGVGFCFLTGLEKWGGVTVKHQPDSNELARGAEVLSVLGRQKLDAGDVAGAVASCETAVSALQEEDAYALKAQCYANLGEALLAAHKARRAARLMVRFMRSRGVAAESVLDGRIWLICGEALMALGHRASAAKMLQRAEIGLRRGGKLEYLDRCFHLQLQIAYARGAISDVQQLLEEREEEIMMRSKKDPGRIRFLYEKANFQARAGSPSRAIRLALSALEQAPVQDAIHFQVYMLLCRTAAGINETREALGFALTARSWAVDHAQWELEMTATTAIMELIREHGEKLVSGLQDLYRVHGIDITQFIPNAVRRSDEPWV